MKYKLESDVPAQQMYLLVRQTGGNSSLPVIEYDHNLFDTSLWHRQNISSVQIRSEHRTFSRFLLLNRENSNWDCLSVIIMWQYDIREPTTYAFFFFVWLLPVRGEPLTLAGVNDILYGTKTCFRMCFFTCKWAVFELGEYDASAFTLNRAQTLCSLNAIFRATGSFFCAIFCLKLQC